MLVAIDGIDGAGKRTQTALFADALRETGRRVEVVSFPVYGSFFGDMIESYLAGRYGALYGVDARLSSLLFADDRRQFFSSRASSGTVSNDAVLLCDRYVLSNMAHQGVKVAESERGAFFEWLSRLEYEINGIPRPDFSIVLDIEVEKSLGNLEKRAARLSNDIHENDADYLCSVRNLFLELAKKEGAAVVEAAVNGVQKTPAAIHEEIMRCYNNATASR